MNCEDFLALADNYKPAPLYWAAGVDKVDVKATDELIVDAANPVGLVVDECKKNPKTSFMPLSNFEWAYCRVKRGRKPGEANA
jgi:acid stress chaperone HdeA